jgi:glyoxylate/hydroxypyruvate reductase A
LADARGILIASGPWEPERWAAAVRAGDPSRQLSVWPEVRDAAAIGYALAWLPPQGALASLPNLRAIFSLGAGVDHLVFQKKLPDVPIVRVVDRDLTRRMTEWVTLQVLMHHRQQRAYDLLQRQKRWRELPQPAAAEVRVGIMGMGRLGRDASELLSRIGFRVAGWSRTPSSIPGVESFAGREQLDTFLARTDILVALLPLTDETRGILAMPLLRKLARGGALGAPVLINAGRGGLQVESDIVAALDDGLLGGASLDVFEAEPLPATSPLWHHPKIIITPHAAAWSSPETLVPPILAQIAAYEAGAPLTNVVDRRAQY